jgi:hypothetical protein
MAALKKNHFFFGNNPNEMTQTRGKVPFVIKDTLLAYMNSDYGDQIYGIIISLLEFLELKNLTDEEYNNTIEKSLESFDEVLQSFARPIFTPSIKGRRTQRGVRLPSKPNTSPLLLKEEMDFINKFISPIYQDLEDLKKNWVSKVFTTDWDTIIKSISIVMDERWKLLEKFASITTKRLQQIRKIDADAKGLRKAQIQRKHVVALLLSRKGDIIKDLYNEILSVIPNDKRTNLMSEVIGDQFHITESNWKPILYYLINQLYSKVDELKIKLEAPPEEEKLQTYQKLIECVSNTRVHYNNILNQVRALNSRGPENVRTVATMTQCYHALKNLTADLNQLKTFELIYALTFLNKELGTAYKSLNDFFNIEIIQKEKLLEKGLKVLESKHTKETLTLLTEARAAFKKIVEESIDSFNFL